MSKLLEKKKIMSEVKTKEQGSSVHRDKFLRTLADLMHGISAMFPECSKSAQLADMLEGVVNIAPEALKDSTIQDWHVYMSPHYDICLEKKIQPFIKVANTIPHLKDIDLAAKWNDPEFTQSSRENLWKFVNRLNFLAGSYFKVPPNIETTISSIAKVTNFNYETFDQIRKKINNVTEKDFNFLMQDTNALMDLIANYLNTYQDVWIKVITSIITVAGKKLQLSKDFIDGVNDILVNIQSRKASTEDIKSLFMDFIQKNVLQSALLKNILGSDTVNGINISQLLQKGSALFK